MRRMKAGAPLRTLIDTLEPRQLLTFATPYHLQLAQRMVQELTPATSATPELALTNNVYTNGAATVTWAGINGATVTKNASDCTTFITNLLKTAYGYTSTQMNNWFGATSPNLDTYYAKGVANKGFEAYTDLASIKPGDLFITDYIDNDPARGHMGLIESAPVRRGLLTDGSGLTRWDVTIIDCTGAPHTNSDTRAGVVDPSEATTGDGYQSGVGRGYLSFFTNETTAPGQIYTWSWSAINNAFRYSPVDEPIRLFKVQPTVNNSNFVFGNEGQTVNVDFERPMNLATIASSDLVITNLTTNTNYSAGAWTATADGSVVTFTLPANLPNGNYQFKLSSGSVATPNGNTLAATHVLKSDSTFLLAGDLDRDRDVDFDDLLKFAKNYGKSDQGYFGGDINYDPSGNVDFDDLLIIAKAYGTTLGTANAIGSDTAALSVLSDTSAASSSSLTRATRTRVADSVL